MKKSILLFSTLLLLQACKPNEIYLVDHVTIKIIGDEICSHEDYGASYPHIAGIHSDCSLQRSISESVTPNDEYRSLQYDYVFFAFGHFEDDISVFQDDLNHKLLNETAVVYCILPDTENSIYSDVVSIIKSSCPNVINPRDHGFYYENGFYGSNDDHIRFGNWLSNFVDELDS